MELPDSEISTREIVCEKSVYLKENTTDCTFKMLYEGEEREYKFVLNFVE